MIEVSPLKEMRPYGEDIINCRTRTNRIWSLWSLWSSRICSRHTLSSGGTLIFCGHHAKKHEEQLKLIATEYVDETDRLGATN